MVFVSRREKESSASLLRRFSRKAQQAGLVIEARKARHRRKKPSRLKKRQSALRREHVKGFYKQLLKQGIIEEGQSIPQQLKKKLFG